MSDQQTIYLLLGLQIFPCLGIIRLTFIIDKMKNTIVILHDANKKWLDEFVASLKAEVEKVKAIQVPTFEAPITQAPTSDGGNHVNFS